MQSFCCALIAASQLVATDPAPDTFAFFGPSVNVTAKNRQRLESGAPLVSILESEGRDVAVFSAVELPDVVTPARMTAWLRNVVALRKSDYVIAIQRFSNPPRQEDLEGLLLDANDLADIRACRPARCGVKLSADEIAELHGVMRAAGTQWKAAVQIAFRGIVFRRVAAYAAAGHAALPDFHDRKRPRSPAAAFGELLRRSTFLTSRAPWLVKRLEASPGRSARDAETFLYWSKEQMGGKTVISATDVTIFRGDGVRMPEVLMTGKQIFATHYLDACLGVTSFVRDRRTSRAYLVYLNRSDVDLLDGFWAGIARRMIENRIEADGPTILRDVLGRLSSGDPPSPSSVTVR